MTKVVRKYDEVVRNVDEFPGLTRGAGAKTGLLLFIQGSK
jgi:hypothetical protein